VADRGWIHDDALISFRYASNVLEGHGPVFNVGERVQGYTHPLWLALLTGSLAFAREPLYIVVILGVALTVATIAAVTVSLFRLAGDDILKAGLVILAWTVALLASESWLDFQTGGLENPLTHLLIALIVIELFRSAGPRLLAVTLLASLLFLTRPDAAFLLAPLGVVVVLECWRSRRFLPLLGVAPAVLWLAFSFAYYGDLMPNTAQAKVGVYESWRVAADQGLAYVNDWVQHEPLPAAFAVVAIALILATARSAYHWALLLGALLYLAYVVYVGGDYMRGRFMLPFYFTVVTLAAALVASEPVRVPQRVAASLAIAVLAMFAFFAWSQPPQDGQMSARGISNERLFYEGFSLDAYRETGELTYVFYTREFVEELEDYAALCDGLTLHTATVGYIGFYAGSGVTIVDTVGLNDEYIAGLPRRNLAFSPPRPGHPLKYIPLSYLASKQDISIFEGWEQAVHARDCSFKELPGELARSATLLHPLEVIPLLQGGDR
jgi:arabinofuranosyltransferase